MNISSSTGMRPQPPDPSEFFKKADADGSGGISKDELKTMMENGPKGPKGASASSEAPDIDEIFSEVDTDGDGEISEAENQTHMENMASKGPRGFSGSSSALDGILEKLQSDDTSDEDKDALIKELVNQLKSSGGQTSLFSSKA